MKKSLILGLGFLTLAGVAHADISWPPDTDLPSDACTSQIKDYVTNKLGTEIVSIRYEWAGDFGHESNQQSEAWVRTTQCNGYYVFRLWADHMTCQSAHYGGTPNYIRTVWTTGNCQ